MKKIFLLFLTVAFLASAFLPVLGDFDPIWPTKKNGTAENPANNGSDASGSTETAVPRSGADEEKLLWTNLNTNNVFSGPKYYMNIPVKQDSDPVLVTKIRTYHFNGGNGAPPGTISVYDGNEILGTWQAAGGSAYDIRNVYWEAPVDVVMYPGHTYHITVSDNASWSYNEASENCGMFELYGIWPIPTGPAAEPQTTGSTSQPSASVSSSIPSAVNAGLIFSMGRYEQDNDLSNGAEPIEWQVLTVQGDRALAVSRYVLDCRFFTDIPYITVWDNSALRKWLNNDFYNSAFTGDERDRILLTAVKTEKNPEYGTYGGEDTEDHIFLLSAEEAEMYFPGNPDRICSRTQYARSKLFFRESDDDIVLWQLRSPGYSDNVSSVVSEDGVINLRGIPNWANGTATLFWVRPAFWMKVDMTGVG